MRPLLALSNGIDWLNEKLGGICNWLVLAACVVSAANAMIRYAFGYSSNSWLELQWYMFAIFVMFGASYTFKKNEHVRVEILYLMLSERGQLWLDMIGTLCLPDPVLPAARLSVLAVLHAGLRRSVKYRAMPAAWSAGRSRSSFPSASFSWRCKASPK